MENLKLALGAVYSNELSKLPGEQDLEAQVMISPAFERRMRKLIHGQMSVAPNRRVKRMLLVAVLAALMASALSVQAIRGPIIRFLLDVREECSRLIFNTEEVQTTTASGIFIPKAPEGYTETSRDKVEFSAYAEYISEEGYFLSYSQDRIKGLGMSLNTENAETDWEWINGFDVFVFTNKGVTSMVWSDGIYVYDVTTNGEISELRNFAEKIMEKIQ